MTPILFCLSQKARFQQLLDSSGSPPVAGAFFGLIPVRGQGIYYVDNATNALNLFD